MGSAVIFFFGWLADEADWHNYLLITGEEET